MHATPRHGRIALVAFAVLAVAALLVAVAADPAAPAGVPVTVTLSAAPGGSAQPTLTVDPATELVDHQVVTVKGEGFDPAGSVSLWQCTTDDRNSCATTDFSEIDDDGSFSRTVGVVADGCRSTEAACNLSVEAWGQTDQEYHWLDGRAPLAFAPDSPLVVATPVTASPLTGLADGDAIVLEADGMRPGDGIDAFVCASPEGDAPACLGASGISDAVDEHGHLRYVVRAAPVVTNRDTTTTDCRVDACYLHVDPNEEPTTFALAFDPDAPLAPPPTAYARLVEGDTLEVNGEGFVPTEEVYATTCIKRDGPKQCLFPTTVHAAAGDDGTVAITYEPEPFDGFAGVEDCRGAQCFVLVWGSALGGEERDSVRAPFALDP